MNRSHRILDSEQRFQRVEKNPQSQIDYTGFRRTDVERFATQHSRSNPPRIPADSAVTVGSFGQERWFEQAAPALPIVPNSSLAKRPVFVENHG